MANERATKVNLYNVYLDPADKLIGVDEEVTMADFEQMTETLSGPGILGEIDEPIVGLFSGSEVEIPFSTMYDDIFKAMSPNTGVGITLRASTQVRDASGGVEFKGIRVVYRGMFKSLTSGSMKQGSGTKSSVKLEVNYCLYEVNGNSKLEIDKMNSVYKVNGTDVLAKARSLC